MTKYAVLVSSGRGPAEARRFVALLAAHLQTRCEAAGLALDAVLVAGDDDAPRSIELVVIGDAPAALADTRGTHALLARSATRGRDARKRWFAVVALRALPEVDPWRDAVIDPRDLEITAMRAGGPGGQNVNKVSSAVRVRHVPSGLVVRVADERSQRDNVRRAIARLAARLAAQAADTEARDEATRWSVHNRLERGAPVRTYTLDDRGALAPRA